MIPSSCQSTFYQSAPMERICSSDSYGVHPAASISRRGVKRLSSRYWKNIPVFHHQYQSNQVLALHMSGFCQANAPAREFDIIPPLTHSEFRHTSPPERLAQSGLSAPSGSYRFQVILASWARDASPGYFIFLFYTAPMDVRDPFRRGIL